MGWFGGRVQRSSSKVAVVFGAVWLVAQVTTLVAGWLEPTLLRRELLVWGTVAAAVGLLGVLVSVAVRILRRAPGFPAGWYPDPQDPGLMRFYDGRTWTSATVIRQ